MQRIVLALFTIALALGACVGQRPPPPALPPANEATATPIPPDDHFEGAYEWLLGRARLAQQSGRIRGILFHQGESDTGNVEWLDKVSGMVADLRADLGLAPVPFVAGELLHGGCCSVHNALVNRIPRGIQSSFVVSAEGLNGLDQAHFDLAGQRELGKRYAAKMLAALAD